MKLRSVLKGRVFRVILFFVLGIIMLSIMNGIVTNAGEYRLRQYYGSFYSEEAGSLDAVYIGSSATYAYWLAPVAWERYGIAVSEFASSSQPFEASEYIIREARKTQPDALYIVPIRTIGGITAVHMHKMTDNMPFSWNKIQMVRTLSGYIGLNWADQMEFLFPFIRFHSRWSELTEQDFNYPLDGLKGSGYYAEFLHDCVDVSPTYFTSDRVGTLSEVTQTALDSLLAYCEAEQVNVLFIRTPHASMNANALARQNAIKETVEAHGYPVLDMITEVDEIGLDLTQDFFNLAHTNIHGAAKVTDYIARYLVENYGFEDKRGDPAYSSWDDAYASYTEQYASVYTLDVEWEGEPRDQTLAAPELSVIEKNEPSVTVAWETVPGADGYRVYRKAGPEERWQALDTVGAGELSYTDRDCESGPAYSYTVIAYRDEKSVRYWGDYNYTGITAKAPLEAPELLSLEGSENNLTLTWGEVPGAYGYAVYRKMPSEDWCKIADGRNMTTFTDTDMRPEGPCQYTVRAYYLNESGLPVLGSYNTAGLLYVPGAPESSALKAAEEGDIQ